MIKKVLQCPECNNRFRVPADAIGAAGRRVRCAACKHVWYAQRQDLQAEDGSFLQTDETASDKDAFDALMAGGSVESISQKDDIAEDDGSTFDFEEDSASDEDEEGETKAAPKIDTLFPDVRSSRTDIKVQQAEKRFSFQRNMLYAANAVCLLFVLFLAAIIYRDFIIDRFPNASPFYAAIGYHDTGAILLGDVELLHNTSGSKDEFKIKSLIVNESDNDAPLPTARVRLMDEDGVILQDGYVTEDKVLRGKSDEPYDVNFEAPSALNAATLSVEIGSPIELRLR